MLYRMHRLLTAEQRVKLKALYDAVEREKGQSKGSGPKAVGSLRRQTRRSRASTVSPVCGSTICGAISASGASTKRRPRKRGCGTVSDGSARLHVAIENQIQIDRPRRVGMRPLAPEGAFNLEQARQQVPRTRDRVRPVNAASGGWGAEAARRPGPCRGKTRPPRRRAAVAKAATARCEMVVTVAQVGAKRDGDARRAVGWISHPSSASRRPRPLPGAFAVAPQQVGFTGQGLLEQARLLQHLPQHQPKHRLVASVAQRFDARPPRGHKRLTACGVLLHERTPGLFAALDGQRRPVGRCG